MNELRTQSASWGTHASRLGHRSFPPLLAAGAFLVLSGFQDIQPRLGQPLPGLTPAERDRFEAGGVAFDKVLTDAEGLGPIMNDVGCGACHSQPVRGGFSTRKVTRFGKAASGGTPFDPLTNLGGSLLQEQVIQLGCEETIPPEADVIAERLTPGLFGIGLIEAIADGDIVANEANQPPGFAGFVRWVTPIEGGGQRPGRFGWKGGVATVHSFSVDASLNEMGLTTTLLPVENAPNGDQVLLAQCDAVADPEDVPDAMGFTLADRFTDFQRFLGAPPQTPRSGMSGADVFEATGCAVCHRSTPYVTAAVPEAALSGVVIQPYSDFLLHDMGDLGDDIVDGVATEDVMMTRPLWGLHSRITFLHDGRATGGTFADNIRATIQEHDGEGAASRDHFLNNLTIAEQDQLIAFIGSLGRAECDWEADNDVDFIDWFFMESLWGAPTPTFTPDDPEAVADVDQDGDLDLIDFGLLQRAFTGEL